VKNGPYSRLTPNQKIVYSHLKEHSPFIPVGKNASGLPIKDWNIGEHYHGFYEFRLKKYP
jgi:hypothetical protein